MASVVQLLHFACLLTTFIGPATALSSPTEPPGPDARLLFKFITITPESCNSDSGGLGICYSKQDCSNLAGTSNGNCAKGLGVCCTFTRTCGQQTSFANTNFTNPSYPSAETTATGTCVLTVIPVNDNICQLRLDLAEFTLAQPDVEGVCKDDFMTVTGGASNPPLICGDNNGQHMYVRVDPNSTGNIKINIDSSTTGAKWKIKVTQIACTSTERAPTGCLQYFTETSGVVSSFNYATVATASLVTRQLKNQNYGVCIQSRSDYCSVSWEQPDGEGEYFFSMTGDPGSLPPGTAGVSLTGSDCPVDYVIIPRGEYDNAGVTTTANRFCGFGFPSVVTSSITPHVLYVVTDSTETVADINGVLDSGNIGFSLKYRANACVTAGR